MDLSATGSKEKTVLLKICEVSSRSGFTRPVNVDTIGLILNLLPHELHEIIDSLVKTGCLERSVSKTASRPSTSLGTVTIPEDLRESLLKLEAAATESRLSRKLRAPVQL